MFADIPGPGATDAATGTQSGLSAALIAGIVVASLVTCLLTFIAGLGAGVIAHSLYKKKSTHTSREWLCMYMFVTKEYMCSWDTTVCYSSGQNSICPL